MKALISFTTIILALLIMGTGCKKNSTTGEYYVKATIDTSSFDAEGLSQATYTTSASAGLTSNIISGKASDGKLIQITIITYTGTPLAVGPTPISPGIANANYYPNGLDSAYTNATSGSVNLTQLVPNLVGTFSFTCADNTTVSNGSFSVRLQ